MIQQKTKNKDSTRYYSNLQEEFIAKLFDGYKTPNSGATNFVKGDVKVPDASLLIECKTVKTEKDSISIKREWLEKIEYETKLTQNSNSMLAFNYGPNTKNYFIINEKLAKYLVEKLIEENNN